MYRILIALTILGEAIKRHRRPIMRLALALFVALLGGSFLFYAIEGPRQGGLGFYEAAWSVFFTMVSGDFVDIKPTTALGRLLVTVLIFFGIGLVSIVTATIASALVIDKIKEGQGMKALHFRGHVVICGWNPGGPTIVREIRAADKKRIIVIAADLEDNPMGISDEHVYFVRGDCTEQAVLQRAGVASAGTVVALADCSGCYDYENADARTILTVLTVETMNPAVYTCAELIQPKNRVHLERVHASEVVVSGEYGGKVLAATALNHGLSFVIGDLLTPGKGAEFYKIPLPPALVANDFEVVSTYFRQRHRAIPVAVMRKGEAIVNPEVGFQTELGDELVVIASEIPPAK